MHSVIATCAMRWCSPGEIQWLNDFPLPPSFLASRNQDRISVPNYIGIWGRSLCIVLCFWPTWNVDWLSSFSLTYLSFSIGAIIMIPRSESPKGLLLCAVLLTSIATITIGFASNFGTIFICRVEFRVCDFPARSHFIKAEACSSFSQSVIGVGGVSIDAKFKDAWFGKLRYCFDDFSFWQAIVGKSMETYYSLMWASFCLKDSAIWKGDADDEDRALIWSPSP